MPRFAVSRSLTLNAPLDDCYRPVRDFTRWIDWSPWLLAEPECVVSYDDDGKGYAWDGKIVGAGRMRLLSEIAPTRMDCELTFERPWKSVAAVQFDFSATEGKTTVTWSMESSLPFFLFWMKGMMQTFIGMDYNRGLLMLKDLVELGAVPSEIELPGIQEQLGYHYVGIRQEASIDQIGPKMKAAFAQLCTWMNATGTQASGPCFASYDKFKSRGGTAHLGYIVGFPVNEIPSDLENGMVSGSWPACSAYVVRHTGPYRHLGNAWAVGMMHGRAKLFRQAKAKFRPPFERYDDDPEEVLEHELQTSVCFPVR
jgi:hypothetical protein